MSATLLLLLTHKTATSATITRNTIPPAIAPISTGSTEVVPESDGVGVVVNNVAVFPDVSVPPKVSPLPVGAGVVVVVDAPPPLVLVLVWVLPVSPATHRVSSIPDPSHTPASPYPSAHDVLHGVHVPD
eukprot:CAMPEP_0206215034 /NCGR_PEP_ID=MMETSP0047_2-20121206/1980_1 /ASSEMBLY_ACC=CAM_ASM_000192 /TAXON_ID=195065 /ORGANISM="Chroomonas mesostigmatica_cf, Strain CCMP1168" /LENGTH=128 /DNA_ID=CAMNT_0053637303 /DNA_START=151 /DNA_END=537 /DNA_ORIENTATION=+